MRVDEFVALVNHRPPPLPRGAVRVSALWWQLIVAHGAGSGVSKPGRIPGSIILLSHEIDRWDPPQLGAICRMALKDAAVAAYNARHARLVQQAGHELPDPPFSPFTSPYNRVDYLWSS